MVISGLGPKIGVVCLHIGVVCLHIGHRAQIEAACAGTSAEMCPKSVSPVDDHGQDRRLYMEPMRQCGVSHAFG